jgi:hypothetical protein
MFLSSKDRDTLFSTTFSQLLIKVQVEGCKLIMLRYITLVSVVFPSSSCSILGQFQYVGEVCICLSTASNASSKFSMWHPSTCEGAMNAKNENLSYDLLLEY